MPAIVEKIKMRDLYIVVESYVALLSYGSEREFGYEALSERIVAVVQSDNVSG